MRCSHCNQPIRYSGFGASQSSKRRRRDIKSFKEVLRSSSDDELISFFIRYMNDVLQDPGRYENDKLFHRKFVDLLIEIKKRKLQRHYYGLADVMGYLHLVSMQIRGSNDGIADYYTLNDEALRREFVRILQEYFDVFMENISSFEESTDSDDINLGFGFGYGLKKSKLRKKNHQHNNDSASTEETLSMPMPRPVSRSLSSSNHSSLPSPSFRNRTSPSFRNRIIPSFRRTSNSSHSGFADFRRPSRTINFDFNPGVPQNSEVSNWISESDLENANSHDSSTY